MVDKPVELREGEEEEAEDRSTPRPHVVYVAVEKEGEEELSRPLAAVAWSALAAGLSMGFSMVGEGILRAKLPDAPWRELVSGFGYSMGFLIVVLGRQQLFTENTLTVVLPLLTRPRWSTLGRMLALWAVVLAANVVGALLFAWVAGTRGAFDGPVQAAFADLGRAQVSAGFGLTVLKAVYAGWLIALMVWLLPTAESARVFVIVLVTWLVGIGSFCHSIAGSVAVLYLVTHGQMSAGAFLGQFFVPTVIGNVIGGTSLVAALAHAQVQPSRPQRQLH
ncbi:MAG TPA: formate/nitrite transporter family protein [Myxococcales bacterium]|nr:formate/nitrite transporter family protein [Myxococcales bacterium]